MSPKQAGKLVFLLVCCTTAAALPFKFNPFVTSSDCEGCQVYPLRFMNGPKKGKEVVVSLFINGAPGIGPEFNGSERKLASDIAKKLPEMAKESKPSQKLTVVDPALVNKLKMDNPHWKQMYPSEWGKMLGVDFVFDICLEKMSLYQPGSQNQFYEGRAEVTVDVYDVDAGPGEPKYNYVLSSEYPTGVLDATLISVNRFKQEFLEHLAAELCMKHISHKEDCGIADNK